MKPQPTLRPPRWEGLFSFTRVWHDLYAQITADPVVAHDDEGRDVLCGADVVAIQALGGLHAAHPICIGTEQLLALPPVEGHVRDVIRDARLPFPAIYLDFSSVRGAPLVSLALKDGDVFDLALFGAIVADGHMPSIKDTAGVALAGTGRIIIPFGTGVAFRKATMAGLEFSDASVRHPATATGGSMREAGTMGSYMTDTSPDLKRQEMVTGRLSLERWDKSEITSAWVQTPYAHTDLLGTPLRELLPTPAWGPDPGFFFGGTGGLMVNGRNAVRDDDEDTLAQFQEQATLEAIIVYGAAEYVARVLYLLSAANVDLVDAPVSRQVRRHAERKNIAIAQVVTVRRTQVRRNYQPPSGQKRVFSHQFERRATYRHVTRGPHARADLMRPCTRRDEKTGELTCPNGCRLEYVPSHWVGDPSLPMVPKTRRIAIPPPNREDDA